MVERASTRRAAVRQASLVVSAKRKSSNVSAIRVLPGRSVRMLSMAITVYAVQVVAWFARYAQLSRWRDDSVSGDLGGGTSHNIPIYFRMGTATQNKVTRFHYLRLSYLSLLLTLVIGYAVYFNCLYTCYLSPETVQDTQEKGANLMLMIHALGLTVIMGAAVSGLVIMSLSASVQ